MAGRADVRGQLSSLAIYEGDIVAVDTNNGGILQVVSKAMGIDKPMEIPALHYGGVSDAGFYQHCEPGDKVLLTRVHPGSRASTHAIKVIPGANRHKSATEIKQGSNVPPGRTGYPIGRLKQGDIKIRGSGGGELRLCGKQLNTDVFLGNGLGAGVHVNSLGRRTSITTVGHIVQDVSSGHRLFCGDVVRVPNGTTAAGSTVSTGHELESVFPTVDGSRRGIRPDSEAAEVSCLNNPRNPTRSQYRLVINEIAENSCFKGYDKESERAFSSVPERFSSNKERKAIDPGNTLHLEPYQLIEIIGGNVVNKRGELLDPNYGVVLLVGADYSGLGYERIRLENKRSIGYHFQLSTNSISTEHSNDVDNFVFALDKEGILKLNIPASSKTGNVLYPTNAEFYLPADDATGTKPDGSFISERESIPVLLRDKDNNIILPAVGASPTLVMSEDSTRLTGIRYSNEDGYFQGTNAVWGGDGKYVRIHPTKYHNMYAAAEALIANKVDSILVPFTSSDCPGVVMGTPVGQPFERYTKNLDNTGGDSSDLKFMTSVKIKPGKPAIDPGGGVIAAGQDRTSSVTKSLSNDQINLSYTNSFSVSEGAAGFTSTNRDDSGDSKKNPGGKSANLNFEGSIEASVGRDNYDAKSILLDTAGSLIAWLGKDKAGRSLVLQTDGEVLVNVGGASGEAFNKGRFDLRVNVTDKGFIGDDDFTPDGGNQASDYLISISEAGIVIAGMKPGKPMIIRNDGDISIESTAKLILACSSMEQREGNRPAKKPGKKPESTDTPDATIEGIADQITCLADLLADATD